MDKKVVTLYKSEGPRVSVTLRVYIHHETNDLIIEGQDIGSSVEEYCGDSDYEYWLIIPAQDKQKLLAAILAEQFSVEKKRSEETDDDMLLDLVRDRFGGKRDAQECIKDYCKTIGIQTQFHCY